MNRLFGIGPKRVFACICLCGPLFAHAQPSGAPPATPPTWGGISGKSAGYVGGGAAGQAGTDPATLKRTEEQRLIKKHEQSGASDADKAQRKDYKE
ncbi:hypothetical protein [Candidatus Burkholderia verschuerenii]|uniref:hypothetical protein n=1 Tax=Candidatus Burkholderia verschuerenii TaxID=242163 RepID=UPI00067DF964|nr:hypothetical protein [Candidatus Burkholderia verschuerenii]